MGLHHAPKGSIRVTRTTDCRRPRGGQISRRAAIGALFAGTSSLALSGCVVPPGVGRAFAPPPGQIMQIADQAWARMLQQRRVWRNGAANAAAQRVAGRLIPLAGRPDLPWEVVVFDDPAVNAFALPNGKIGLFRGMMLAVENDDQLAAVIGHELGHVTAQHAAARVGLSQASRLGIGLGSALLGGGEARVEQSTRLGIAAADVLLSRPFSREQELEADEIGVAYMARAGYNPVQAIEFWEDRMAARGRSPIEFLSTHPAGSTRIQRLRQIVYGG